MTLKRLHKNFIETFCYSDTELLGWFMSLIIMILNPMIFYNLGADFPLWLIHLGIPFGLYSIYKILVRDPVGRDLSYTLIIGQMIGILFLVYRNKVLFYDFLFQFFIFLYLKWRSRKTVERYNRRKQWIKE
jgi:hypothetical protein